MAMEQETIQEVKGEGKEDTLGEVTGGGGKEGGEGFRRDSSGDLDRGGDGRGGDGGDSGVETGEG